MSEAAEHSIERKQAIADRVEVKAGATSSDPGSMRLYFSTFGNWDRVRPVPERPVKGAFLASFPEFKRAGFVAYGHEHDGLPLGMPIDAGEDEHGGWLEVKFHSTQDAQDARTVVSERVANGLDVKVSMGYRVLQDEYVPIDDPVLSAQGITQGRLLKEIDLVEVSLVNIPANPAANVTAVKDGSLAGLKFTDHSDAMLAVAQEFVTRAKGLADLRLKEGRVLSAANMGKLKGARDAMMECCTMLDDIMAAAMPMPKSDATEVIRKMYLDFLMWEAVQDGVMTK